jgi:ketosteroid isomerase-like protein
MEREQAVAWLEAYRRAWERADARGVLELFTADARYRAHPLRPAHTGHDGVAGYWARATADQRDVRVRLGDPVVDGHRVAAEWWTTMVAGGEPVTLVGCLLLTFAADGRCRDLRECWHETDGLHHPPPDWGRLDPRTGGGDAAVREHARRWAEGYERAWRTADPEAAAALYAPDAHYRSEPFRDPHLGRDGVLAYTRAAYATEADQDPRFGTPLASPTAAAVEWWATTLEEGRPATLIGTSLLTFTPDGLVAVARDYWFLEPGHHQPSEGWGR